jgi:hypothetical protein
MGGVAGVETTKKALWATASDGDGASVHPPEPPEPQQQPAPLPAAAVASNAADSYAAVHHQSYGEEDDQDDE